MRSTRFFAAFPAFLIAVLFATSTNAFDGMVLTCKAGGNGKGPIYLHYLSDGTTLTISDGKENMGPCFSPDGKKIAFFNHPNIYICDINGENKTEVTKVDGSWPVPTLTWGANDWIYWSQCNGTLYRVKTDGSQRDNSYGSANCEAVVSQDGKRVAHWTGSIPAYAKVEQIGGGWSFSQEACHPGVSPDGSKYLFNQIGHTKMRVGTFGSNDHVIMDVNDIEQGASWNYHFWSRHSNDHIMYDLEYQGVAIIHNISNGRHERIEGQGRIFDFYPKEIKGQMPVYATARAELGSQKITVSGNAGALMLSIPYCGNSTIEILNLRGRLLHELQHNGPGTVSIALDGTLSTTSILLIRISHKGAFHYFPLSGRLVRDSY